MKAAGISHAFDGKPTALSLLAALDASGCSSFDNKNRTDSCSSSSGNFPCFRRRFFSWVFLLTCLAGVSSEGGELFPQEIPTPLHSFELKQEMTLKECLNEDEKAEAFLILWLEYEIEGVLKQRRRFSFQLQRETLKTLGVEGGHGMFECADGVSKKTGRQPPSGANCRSNSRHRRVTRSSGWDRSTR